MSAWSSAEVNAWYAGRPWPVGCNFLPSTAVNDVEMWMSRTFDPSTIDRELGWAESLGFNSVRVFLNFVVWQDDAAGLKGRINRFLEICEKHKITMMPVLFDDCNFARRVASAQPQPDPVPGVHNSQWVSSPPLAMVGDPAAWPELERYVRDIVGAFARDRRVILWDLYNEPGNSNMGETSRALMEAAFEWARVARPSQPLTVGPWSNDYDAFSHRMMELSDVVSFHHYGDLAMAEEKLRICGESGRPILCTEWLHRQSGNRFKNMLPLFHARKIGSWNWGLVAGRTQTFFPWNSKEDAPEPAVWQHDIFRADGTPYDADEIPCIRRFTRAS